MPPLIVTDSEYEFVPPHKSRIWPKLLTPMIRYVRKSQHCIGEVEVRGAEILTEIVSNGDGVLLAPNHCRMADALVLHELTVATGQPFFTMASSHLFRGRWSLGFVLRRMGAFSVYREGIDREAIDAATTMLAEAQRPLMIFPEGALSQANDRLNALMEGVSFIARAAAKKVSRDESTNRKIFVLPVAIRYLFEGDIRATVDPMLREIEERLTWRPASDEHLVDRIFLIGNALLGLKETEILGSPQSGDINERLANLTDSLLAPLECEWLNGRTDDSVINRVKDLRRAIVPDLIEDGEGPELDDAAKARRWRHLEDMELAQMLSLFPPSYLASHPSVDRILETVERMAEALTGEEQAHGPMRAIVQVGDPLEVSPKRDRSAKTDPVLAHVESNLTSMLSSLSELSPLFDKAST